MQNRHSEAKMDRLQNAAVPLHAPSAAPSRSRHAFLFFLNILHQLFQSRKTGDMGSMERRIIARTQLHSQRCSSSMNTPSEADRFVAFATDMNIETSST